MAKITPKRRRFQIRQRQKRREKLRKLREKYTKARSEKERETVLEKVFKIAPWLSKEEFLEPVKDKLSS